MAQERNRPLVNFEVVLDGSLCTILCKRCGQTFGPANEWSAVGWAYYHALEHRSGGEEQANGSSVPTDRS